MAPGPVPNSRDLPITAVIDRIVDALIDARRAVVVAPPGAGKTTVVPQRLLAHPAITGRILMLEPRRIAARAAAQRIAELVGCQIGDLVGYTTRDDRRTGPTTRLEVVTEGILTRRLQANPSLDGVDVVLFDEIHERHLTTDLGLALALEVADTVRPDLIIGAMSATPDTDRLRRALGDCPVIESSGQLHPVDIVWVPGPPPSERRRSGDLERRTAATIVRALTEQEGDVLVFLPGIGEIRRTEQALASLIGPGIDIRALAGAVSQTDQDLALRASADGRRRVVLATDIAESSLTVEGIRVVVDCGLSRVPRHDQRTGMSRLVTVTSPRSSADQRAGRAGRVAPGACYRMWSTIEHGARQPHRTPEIAEADLSALVLESRAWGTPINEMRFLTPPTTGQTRAAEALLSDLGAIDGDGRPTDLGRRMLELPLHPRLAAMVIEWPDSLSMLLAALLDDRDVLRGRPDERPSDLGDRVAVLVGVPPATSADIDRDQVDRTRRRANDLARRIGIEFDVNEVDPHKAGQRLVTAFPDRLAGQRRPGQFQMRTGTAAWLPDTDPLATADLLIAVDLDGRRDRARIRMAAEVELGDVTRAFERANRTGIEERNRLEWDPGVDDLVAIVERRLGAIRFAERRERARPSDATTRALMDRVRTTGLAVLPWTGTALALRDRVRFLQSRRGAPWPDWSSEALLATVDDWLAPYLVGSTSRGDLESLDLTMLLRAALPWPLGIDVDELAPTSLQLPSGREPEIVYVNGVGELSPSARVRVQDLFGVDTHPTVDGVPVTLHLLNPADRELQITSDLPGFWRGEWASVRREMAGRYPKHQWPVDPATADPRRLKRDDQ